MPRRIDSDVTETELAVLNVLWDEEPATVRLVAERLYPPGGASACATVQKLLQRLEKKRHVERVRSSQAQQFRSIVTRDDIINHRIRTVADEFCGGSLSSLLSRLVAGPKLSARERGELRQFLDQLSRDDSEPQHPSR